MKLMTLAAVTASTIILTACGAEEKEVAVVETAPVNEVSVISMESTLDERLSYIVGDNIATQFQRDEIELNIEAFSAAVDNIKAGNDPLLSEEDKRQTIAEIQQRAQEKQKAELETLASQNVADGAAYLAANSQKEGVITTESGLQYKEVVSGDGEVPAAADTVTVHYKGTLTDGTVFDSSYDRGAPATFPVGGVIPGWIEALQLMNVGDKFELAIPSDLAYGPSGTGPVIGPNATLLFEVELLELAKAEVIEDVPAVEEAPAAE